MEVQGNGFANEMAVYFDPAASDNYQLGSDATILFSPIAGVPNIYTVADSFEETRYTGRSRGEWARSEERPSLLLGPGREERDPLPPSYTLTSAP